MSYFEIFGALTGVGVDVSKIFGVGAVVVWRGQRWATATLLVASLPLFVKFNSGATVPVTE